MRFAALTLLIAAITVVNAHFQMAFPPPRGPFDEENEVNFCDNYVNAANRTEFPLSGGFVTLTSEHVSWSLAILLSTVQNPTSFDNFTGSSGQQQFARNFSSASGAGDFCIPLNLSDTGISGVADSANVTIQLVFNGGDGSLYQCADLTLSSNFSIPSNISCSNSTGSGSKTSPASSTSTGNSGSEIAATGFAGVFAFLVALVTV
ncbi:hypothetical protein BC826DRAFT_908206 [Russula brevipes]|nr:hypothetical protein BC826DRAFT_908206 [Russula brevipes]